MSASSFRRQLCSQAISAFTTIDSIFVSIVPISPPATFLHTYTRHEVDHHADTIASNDPRAAAARRAREYFLESWADRSSVEFAMGSRGIRVRIGPERPNGSPLALVVFFTSRKFLILTSEYQTREREGGKRKGGKKEGKRYFIKKLRRFRVIRFPALIKPVP